jgi:guanine nucleotide-binding protein G(I)/G(S)/G(T) subunit beta-1
MDNNPDIAERITAARREAESLKEKIKQKKDALADTTCKCFASSFTASSAQC